MGTPSKLMDRLAIVSVFCLLVLTAQSVYRNFRAPPIRSSSSARIDEPVDDWLDLVAVGQSWGEASAPATLLVFTDFECPFCRRFALGAEAAAKRRHTGSLRIITRHYPLSYHKFAFSAAKASECAAQQGRFHELYSTLFSKQDSLGLKTFHSYAVDAGIPDLVAFDGCMLSASVEAQIEADLEAARLAGATGTPTVILNGLRLGTPPDSARLDQLVTDVIEQAAARSR